MILTVDIGNSNIVLGGVEGNDILFVARLRTDSTKTSDQYCVDLKILLDVYGVTTESIEGTIICSVVPPVLNSFQTAIHKLTRKAALVVGPGIRTGLDIRIENPAQIGADLVVSDVAALREHKPPLIVIDMGTATTMSVLDETGAHIGGCIIPGVNISVDALTSRTALLPGNLAGGLGGLWVDSAVSYGTGSRDTLTLSSREEGRLWAALQREVVTVDGALVERQEFPLRLRPGVEENTLLAQAGALVLLGVPPQKVDQVLGKNQKFLAKQQTKW